MNEEEKHLIERFTKNARPADRVPVIMQLEIIGLLKDIKSQLNAMNKIDKPAKSAGRSKIQNKKEI